MDWRLFLAESLLYEPLNGLTISNNGLPADCSVQESKQMEVQVTRVEDNIELCLDGDIFSWLGGFVVK